MRAYGTAHTIDLRELRAAMSRFAWLKLAHTTIEASAQPEHRRALKPS
jgi:hypothetical protein